MSKSSKAYIHSYASISPGANSAGELYENICTHKSGITITDRYSFENKVAIGLIQNKKSFEQNLLDTLDTVVQSSDFDPKQTLLVLGSSVGGIYITEEIFFKDGSYKNIDPQMHHIEALTHMIEKKYDFKKAVTFSTACTSSANALGYAHELITKGIYSDAVVIGADAISFTTVNGFRSLDVLSSTPCQPFDKDRAGMNVSEAVAILHLSDKRSDLAVYGAGYSSDAHHITQPHPQGLGAVSAMQNALKDANLKPEDIGYINAHGTGTNANDLSEAVAVDTLFTEVKVSSTKSITGHTLGAAGALEAIITIEALKHQTILPNTNLNTAENKNINLPTAVIKDTFKYALSNSFAFGGNNTSIVIGRCDED